MFEQMMGPAVIFGIAIVILVVMVFIGKMFARMYTRASKELSFVRTGFGGQKVILNGGSLVLPVIHEVIPVNMNTLKLDVNRCNEQALITRDRMRVDVTAEFYVRVQPTEESIANAINKPTNHLCQACITGRYPTEHGQRLYEIALSNVGKADLTGRTYEVQHELTFAR